MSALQILAADVLGALGFERARRVLLTEAIAGEFSVNLQTAGYVLWRVRGHEAAARTVLKTMQRWRVGPEQALRLMRRRRRNERRQRA